MPPKKNTTVQSSTWLLVRDDKSNDHYVINVDRVLNLTKKKFKSGDSVIFSLTGDRSDRARGSIITIGDVLHNL